MDTLLTQTHGAPPRRRPRWPPAWFELRKRREQRPDSGVSSALATQTQHTLTGWRRSLTQNTGMLATGSHTHSSKKRRGEEGEGGGGGETHWPARWRQSSRRHSRRRRPRPGPGERARQTIIHTHQAGQKNARNLRAEHLLDLRLKLEEWCGHPGVYART